MKPKNPLVGGTPEAWAQANKVIEDARDKVPMCLAPHQHLPLCTCGWQRQLSENLKRAR